MKNLILGDLAMIKSGFKSRLLAGSFIGVPAILVGSVSAYAGAPAMPTGGHYVAGQGQIGSVNNGQMVIRQNSARGVIDWQGFSIGKDGKVIIRNGAGATLNRVTSAQMSRIAGTLKSTGSTYLINPHGIIISSSGKVITGGGFVASTRNITNKNFMGGGTLEASGDSKGDIINKGQIVARDGNAILIGHGVSNSGSVTAKHGVAALVAGNKVYLRQEGGPDAVYVAAGNDHGNVTNDGKIRAAAAELASQDGNVYALAGNHKGQIQATGTKTIKGQVWLDASNGIVVADSKISGSDKVDITGKTVHVGHSADIHGGNTVNIGAASHGVAESEHTTIASNAKISAGNHNHAGRVETSGRQFSMGLASVKAGKDGTWLIDPTNLTIDSTAATTIDNSLNSATNVVEQTTATTASGSGVQTSGSGDINVNAPLTWTGTGSLTLEAYGSLNINASITGSGSFTGLAGNTINLASAIKAASGITLSGAAFVNSAGGGALGVNPGSSWTIYTPNASADTYDGLSADYIQYAAKAPVIATSIGGTITSGTTPAGTGNGFLYAVTPSVTVSLSGTVTKTYDGTTSASIGSNLSVSGLINGDVATGTGSYATANAGSDIAVSVNSLSFQTSTGLPIYGYAWTNQTYSANIGTIDQKQLSASIIGNPTKVYDQTDKANLTSANFDITGFVTGQGATVTQNGGATYASSSAGSEQVTATLGSTDFSAGTGTDLNNYILPTTATGAGTINKAPIDLLGVTAGNKVYDGTTVENLNLSGASLYGVDAGDQVSLVTTGATGTFAQSNVGNNIPVALTGVNLTGAQAGDYTLVAPPGFAANITPKALTISGVSATNKVYDGTTFDNLSISSPTLNGVISGDTVNLSVAGSVGNFTDANVGNGINVITSGFNISGASASDYTLVQPVLTANITPAPLSISVIGNPTKTYDGTTRAVVGQSNIAITGFVTGQGATLAQNGGATYANANAGSEQVTVTFQPTDFSVNPGTLLSNYIVPTFATGAGSINTAPVEIAIVGDPTKTYDGSTNGSLSNSNYQVTGLVGGQSVSINDPIGTYNSANAGIEGISANLPLSDITAGSNTNLSNYSFPTTVSGYGTILKQALTGDISAAITGNPTKVYDGSTTISLLSSDFTLSGFASGQGATINSTLTGNFATPNAGIQPISVPLSASDFTANSGTNLANYTLPTVAYGPGVITPALLSGVIVSTPTKTYDTTTNVTIPSGTINISGLIGTDNITVNQEAGASYASANAGAEGVNATVTTPDFVAAPGTNLANYTLPTTITGNGYINRATLGTYNISANSKVYDGTTTATLNDANAGLIGVDNGDTVSLVTSGATASFGQSNVGNSLAVTDGGFTLSGASAGNYIINQPTGLTANITPKALTITGVTVANKNYDGTTSATLNDSSITLNGVLTGDTVNLSSTGATASFLNANAGSNIGVSVSGFSISGSSASNYTIVQPTGLTASINKAQITAAIIGDPTKTYDATTNASLNASNFTLSGFASGQGASVPQSATSTYANANAGSETVNATLAFTDFSANSGTFLGNYVLPTTATGTGTINQATLSAKIVGDPTKTYDSTTSASLTSSNYQLSGFVGGQSATITQTAGTYSDPNVGNRTITASLASTNFTNATGTDLNNYILPTSATGVGTITPDPITISGITAANKIYDGTTTATISSPGSLVGVYASDAANVSISTSGATANFANANAGTGIGVNITGLSLTGSQAYDYTLNPDAATTANINQKTLGLVNVTKVYDANTSVPTVNSAYTLSGVVGSDQVYINASSLSVGSSYYSSNVGSGIAMTVDGITLGGAQSSNYTMPSNIAGNIGTITPAPLYITGVKVNNKAYDGTTLAYLNDSNDSLSGIQGSDSLVLNVVNANGTYASKNVGNNIPVSVSGYTISGTAASNYQLFQPTGVTGNIFPDTLTLNLTGVTKVYDGTTNLPTVNAAYSLSGVYSGDSVSINASGLTGSYASSNAASGIDVSISGITLTGPQASDYSISSSVTNDPVGTITPRPITGSIIGNPTKTYDATNAASLGRYDTLTNRAGSYSFSGFVSGQGITVNQTSGTYNSPTAGSKTVTASLSGYITPDTGTLLSNYILPSSVSGAGTINKAGIVITGVTATNKVYDKSYFDTLNTSSASLSGVVSGDQVNLVTTGANGTFANDNVGNGIVVTASGFSISGAQAANYTLTQPTGLTANITPAPLSLINVEKVYDSTTSLPTTNSAYTLSGIYAGDQVVVNASVVGGSYAFKNVGGNLPLSLYGLALTGAQASDYSISSSYNNATIGTITPATVTISGITGTTMTYNGTNQDPLNYTNENVSGVFIGDQVTPVQPADGSLASPNVGNNTSVSIGTITLSGVDAANYVVSQQTTTTGSVTPAPLTLSFTGDPSKIYDGTTTGSELASNINVTGFISGQGATISNVAGNYAAANAGAEQFTAPVSMSDFTASNASTILSNYNLTTNSISLPGVIDEKALTASIVNNPTKAYDGTNVATLNSANYSLSGFVTGQGATVNQTSGTYGFTNAGFGDVNATLQSGDFTANTGTNLNNYILPTSATGIGTINPALLGVTLIGIPTKTYDGTNVATLNSSDYALSGLAPGESITINQTSGTYGSSDAGNQIVSVNLPSSDFSAGANTSLSNYILPSGVNGAGLINQKALALSLIGNPTKIYDGTTSATLNSADFSLTGFVTGQGATINQTSGTYNSANVGNNIGYTTSVQTSNYNFNSGTLATNYILPIGTFTSTLGAITQRQLDVSITGNPTKTYDGTTTATLNSGDYTISGFVNGQGATINQTNGTYAIADAGNQRVSVSLNGSNYVANAGTDLSNYILSNSARGYSLINKATLTASITGNPTKTYDGSTLANLTPTDFSLSGFVTGQGATVNQTFGLYANSNAGIENVSTSFVAGNFSANSGTNLSNYNLPTTASGMGYINQRILTLSGNIDKTYDGNNTAALNSGNVTVENLAPGESINITPLTGTFSSANAGISNVSAYFLSSNFTAGSGTNLSNYVLPVGPDTFPGLINPKTITASIIGNPTKTYDASNIATLTSANYSLSGFISGQGATVNQTGGTYNGINAGTGYTVTANLTNSDFAANTGTDLNNYILPTSAAGLGSITPAQLGVSIIGNPTKTYDGTNSATLTSANYSITGFVNSEGATINQTSGTYAAADAGSEAVTTSLTAGNYIANSGTDLNNYILPTTATGAGTINQKALTISISGNPTKTYDGTTTATLNSGDYTITGFVNGQSATLNQTSGTYSSANAGYNMVVANIPSSSFFSAAPGTNIANYSYRPLIAGPGTINTAPVTISIIGNPTKTYDGTTTATLNSGNFEATGFVNGQGVTVNHTSGTYASANAGPENVSATLSPMDFTADSGTNLNNYSLTSLSVSGLGTINQKQLAGSIFGVTGKTYDGTTNATIDPIQYSLTGLVSGQRINITATKGYYAGPNAGSENVYVNLSPSDYSAQVGTDLNNYILPTTISGAGQINPAQLAVSITGNPTKTYDGTTTATLNSGDYTITGFVNGQGATINQTSGTYSSQNAGTENVDVNLIPANYTANAGTDLTNYILPGTAAGFGTINQKVLTVSIIGNPTKTYDGSTAIGLGSNNYSINGFVTGQGATINQTIASYGNANAGVETVSADLNLLSFNPHFGTDLGNYVLPTSATGNGYINQKQISVSLIGNPTKTYDGTTTATLNSSDYSISGFVKGQGATIIQTGGTYSSANAGSETVTSGPLGGFYQGNGFTNLANYILPDFASGVGTINRKLVTGEIVGNPAKTYDGNTNANLNSTNYALIGFIGGQGATVTNPDGTYAGPQAGNEMVYANLVNSNFAAKTGTNLDNYILPIRVSGLGYINQKVITINGLGVSNKIFNARTNASLTGTPVLQGVVPGDQVSLIGTAIANFAKAQVGNHIAVTMTGYSITGAQAGNYELSLPTLYGKILPANLIEAVAGNINGTPFAQISAARNAETQMSYIPFPAPDGVSTRNVNSMAPLPNIIDGNVSGSTTSVDVEDGTVTIGTNEGQPVMTDPEQILLQGSKTKRWTIKYNTAMNNSSN